MRARILMVAAVAAMAMLGSAACGGKAADNPGGTNPTGTPAQGLGSVPAAATTPAPTKPPAPTKAAVAPLTCDQIKTAQLGSPALKYNGYTDSIPLSGGTWSGEDGNKVTLTVCGVGDLNGDGAADAIGSVQLDGGGSGRFYTLAVWLDDNGQPKFAALKDLDDRTPVQSITIAGGKATVVYFTRHADEPSAMLSITRTAIFTLSGTTLTEVSHTDGPYTGG